LIGERHHACRHAAAMTPAGDLGEGIAAWIERRPPSYAPPLSRGKPRAGIRADPRAAAFYHIFLAGAVVI
jgi:hypothetical protein